MSKHTLKKPINGILLDITGVLYNSGSGDGEAIAGSIEAVKKIHDAKKTVRFLSNESTDTKKHLTAKLRRLGFSVDDDNVFIPAPLARKYLAEHNLRPMLLIHPNARLEFDGVDESKPNCVLMGDAEEEFTYDNLNAAFRLLLSLDKPLLLTLGCNKYYQRMDGPCLDVGAFAKLLEFAVPETEKIPFGKPEASYFQAAVDDMGLKKEEVVMIGDDAISDVYGAQQAGIRGIQVKTGKYRAGAKPCSKEPDAIFANLAEAVDAILNLDE